MEGRKIMLVKHIPIIRMVRIVLERPQGQQEGNL
jgi:hypothetical protein